MHDGESRVVVQDLVDAGEAGKHDRQPDAADRRERGSRRGEHCNLDHDAYRLRVGPELSRAILAGGRAFGSPLGRSTRSSASPTGSACSGVERRSAFGRPCRGGPTRSSR
jgi:hypothetical protein